MSTDPHAQALLRRQQALQRLEASRLRLRLQLLDLPEAGDASPSRRLPQRVQVLWRALRRRLRASPVASVALAAVHDWWRSHPLRSGGELLAYELNASLAPAIRRHPGPALLLGVAGGLGLILMRPWRWPVVAGQLKPLPRRLGHWLLTQLSQAPLQALMSALLGALAGRAAAGASADGGEGLQRRSPPPG